MPIYNYQCPKCELVEEQCHSIHKDPIFKCPECKTKLKRMIGSGIYITTGLKPSLEDGREADHTKKVKDPERAIKMRKKAFGSDEVGNPVSEPDPRHIIKKGRTLGGQQTEIDKGEFVRAAAKDPVMVKKAQDVLKNHNN